MQQVLAKENKKRYLLLPRSNFIKNIQNILLNILYCLFIPMLSIVTCEWISRGTLGPQGKDLHFFMALKYNFLSFLAAYLLLVFIHLFFLFLTKRQLVSTLIVALIPNSLGIATFFKLSMRNEPLLPWDLLQIGTFAGIMGEVTLEIQPNMIITVIIFAVLSFIGYHIKLPKLLLKRSNKIKRYILSAISLILAFAILIGVFLNPGATQAIGIEYDMWMQDRFYRYNGALSGFLTNLQMLNIEKPQGYSQNTINSIIGQTQNEDSPFLFGETVAAGANLGQQNPDVIFIMSEGFWDMQQLEGISYDRVLTPNLNRLSSEGASGLVYTPSFGGGTCDVEFEALTGMSMDFLPAGSKAFQQYINDNTFSLPWWLKQYGYDTLAIHGYGRRFWNRDVVYPRLGIDTYIAEEDMQNAERRRGFISDMAITDRIIEELENRSSEDSSVFIHAVTMQNHTTYSPSRYPSEDLVQITDNSAGLSADIIAEMQECATGMYEADAALGRLTDYLLTVDKPTIVVFWGDHLNPMSNGYGIYEDTGFIQPGDTQSPDLYKTPLLIWSNTLSEPVDLGVISTYYIAPVMMELYGFEMPDYFEYLSSQLHSYTATSKGTMHFADGTSTRQIDENQQQLMYNHSVLQYDLLFGEEHLISDLGLFY